MPKLIIIIIFLIPLAKIYSFYLSFIYKAFLYLSMNLLINLMCLNLLLKEYFIYLIKVILYYFLPPLFHKIHHDHKVIMIH